MHELSVTEHILSYAIEEAQKQHADRILRIHLRLGPLSGMEPECIQMYMDLLAEGTIAQGVRIEATKLPLKVCCKSCGKESEITRRRIACPYCGSLKLKMHGGREFLIDSLEVADDGNQSTPSGNGME